MRSVVVSLVLCATIAGADAAVLCVAKRSDGSLRGTVRARQACRPSEVELAPDMVGFCCSTSTTTVTTTSCPIITSTTLGIPDCGGTAPACLGLCSNAHACVDDGSGHCGCTGPELPCGVVTYQGMCGGTCSPGFTCQLITPVQPSGCPGLPFCGCAPQG